jgi:HEAT repeat protein
MQSLTFIEMAIVVVVGLNVLMAFLTISVKAARSVRRTWYWKHLKRIESALENYMITGEDQPELDVLPPWKRDLFVSRLIVERMFVLRGSGKEHLLRLADRLGLVDRYLKELSSRRRWRRARAAEYLGYFGGERSVRPLGELLADSDETVRAVAARSLARIGTQEAARILAKTLDDPSEPTRLRVSENLERIGSPSVKPLVEVLEGWRKAREGWLHGPIQAAQVLGQLRASESRPVLGDAALRGRNVDLRAQATLALGKIGDPEDIPKLLRATGDEEWPVRAQAANALGMIGDVSTVPTLQRLMTDHEWWVRLNAAQALANMGLAGESALVEVLEGPDHFARRRAAATLEARGVTRRMVGELAAPDKRGERARRTVRALIHAGATKHLERLARTMPNSESRRALQAMLAEAIEL